MSARIYVMPFMWPAGVEPEPPLAPVPLPFVDIVTRGNWPDHAYDVVMKRRDGCEALASFQAFSDAEAFAEEHYRDLFIGGVL